MESPVRSDSRIGKVLCGAAPFTGWPTSSKKPRNASCGKFRLAMRLHDFGHRHRRRPTGIRRSRRRLPPAPCREVLVDQFVVLPAPGAVANSGILAQAG